MPSDLAALLGRHDPDAWRRTLQYRSRAELPFDPSIIDAETPVMLDTTVYIDALRPSGLPAPIAILIARNIVLHSAIARAELTLTLGHLDPADPRTARNRPPLQDVLARMAPSRVVAPTEDAWSEASLIAGILARIQAYARESRRALLNDALLVLSAIERGAALISRNINDMDLLLRFRPDARIVLYDLSAG